MSYKRRFRVKETTTTTGTGTLQFAGAEAGFLAFINQVGDTNRCSYFIFESGTGAAERGIGIVAAGAPNTLSRDIVVESTNGGAKVNLAAGTKMVFIDSDPHVLGGPWVDAIAKTANYTVALDDAGVMIEVTTGAADVTITLPAIAGVWPGFSVGVRKVDAGAGKVIVDGDAAEQIDGYATRKLWAQYDQVNVTKGSGASWACLAKIADRIVTFTTSGTWTREDGLSCVDVEVQAAGGSGAGAVATGVGQGSCGAGGGAGGVSIKKIGAASLGSTEAVTVGAGAAGSVGGAGSSGGASSFGAHCSATGGPGGGICGTGSVGASAPASGAGSGGDINIVGGPAGSAINLAIYGSPAVLSGSGGSTRWGGGGYSIMTGGGSAGIAGAGYGSGGSGAANGQSQSARAGGAGAGGLVTLREQYR